MAPRETQPKRGRKHIRGLRWAASTALTLGLIAFSVGATLSIFSATMPHRSGSLLSGTVSLNANVTGACSASNILAGGSATCTLTANYMGSASAYLGLDILIETQAGNGGTALYHPSDSPYGLQVSVSSASPSTTFTVPTSTTTCPGSAPTSSTCYELDKELVSTSALTSQSPTVTFSTTVSVPSASTAAYRGGSAEVLLTVHATQASNNSVSGCSAGAVCTLPRWS